MTARKIDMRNQLYVGILEELYRELPRVHGKIDVGLPYPHIVDIEVLITPAYYTWLARKKEKDVSNVRYNDQGTMFTPGKHAVQFVIARSISIVRQLLEKGVDPDVAVGLLPKDIAEIVIAKYKRLYG